MKALPLWQPWAALVVLGAKRIETRSWKPPASMVGQRIAIYATVGGLPKRETDAYLFREFFYDALVSQDARTLQAVRGAILGTVVLERATLMTPEAITRLSQDNPAEHAFGMFAVDRYAWVLRDPHRLPTPVDTRPPAGRRGPFDWTPA